MAYYRDTYKKNKSANVRINVTMRRVRVTLLPWKSYRYYKLWECVCSLNYPPSKTHAPYYIGVCELSCSTIFFFFHNVSEAAQFSGEK
jgi:hypothetical protein